jgi:hypothetical protein
MPGLDPNPANLKFSRADWDHQHGDNVVLTDILALNIGGKLFKAGSLVNQERHKCKKFVLG